MLQNFVFSTRPTSLCGLGLPPEVVLARLIFEFLARVPKMFHLKSSGPLSKLKVQWFIFFFFFCPFEEPDDYSLSHSCVISLIIFFYLLYDMHMT